MLLILPPSETKRDGGAEGSCLDLSRLRFPELTDARASVIAALEVLSADADASAKALKLGRTQLHEIDRNRAVSSSPVLPAVDRYTGVLYDGLNVASWTEQERRFAADHVVIHSALLGPTGAGDGIPAYRLSHNSALPGLPLRKHWRDRVSAVLASHPGLVIDLRSEAYAALGPAPAGAWYIRVVSEDSTGRKVALSHFNKKSKGEFVRRVVGASTVHDDLDSLLEWAAAAGIRLERGAPGELDLVVSGA